MVPAQARLDYLRPALKYGLKVHLGNLITFLNYRLDLFLVNLLAGPAAAGIYTVAVRLVEQLWMISTAVSTVIFPRLASMAGDDASRRMLTPIIARSVLWITLLGAGVLAALAQPLIAILFGHEFAGAVVVILIFLPGIVLFACARILAHDMAARGKVGVNLAIASIVLVINASGNLLLIPTYGVIGAAAATTLAYTIAFVIHLALQQWINETRWWILVIPMIEDLHRLRRAITNRARHEVA